MAPSLRQIASNHLHELYNASRRSIYQLCCPLRASAKLQKYWKNPPDGEQGVEALLNSSKHQARTRLLLRQWPYEIIPAAKIVELGCGPGRNLSALYKAGFHNLIGVDINKTTLHHPTEPIRHIERDIINYLACSRPASVDVIFTVAVLMHLPEPFSRIADDLRRVTRSYIITMEQEKEPSWRVAARNYGKILPNRFWQQQLWSRVPQNPDYVLRIFRRR